MRLVETPDNPVPPGAVVSMARAVDGWSPVIILTVMPARWQCRIASIASGRGGSIIPCRPRSTRSPSTSSTSSFSHSAGTRFDANASTRMPRSAMRSTSRSAAGASSAAPRALAHRRITTSGAPLTRIARSDEAPVPASGAVACSVAMNWCSLSKGIASRRAWRSRTFAASMPSFAAATTSAPSVGSPLIDQTSSLRSSVASLHRAPARSRSPTSSGVDASAEPSRSRSPSGAYPTPLSEKLPLLGVQISWTVISLRVSVPVLSEQMMVVDPSVSTAGSLRTTARRPAIR